MFSHILQRAVFAPLGLFLILLSAPLALAGGTTEESDRVDVAVVFLVDVSHSMNDDEIGIARDSHIAAFRSEEVLSAIRSGLYGRIAVAYVEFAGNAAPVVPWMIIEDEDTVEEFVHQIETAPVESRSYTGIGTAFFMAASMFEQMPYKTERMVVDIVGDGINNIAPSADAGREVLLSGGAVINGMPLLLEPSSKNLDIYYASRVVGGAGSFSMPLKNISQMPSALRSKIVLELF